MNLIKRKFPNYYKEVYDNGKTLHYTDLWKKKSIYQDV